MNLQDQIQAGAEVDQFITVPEPLCLAGSSYPHSRLASTLVRGALMAMWP